MARPKKIRRGNEYIPALFAWQKDFPKPAGIFGQSRDFPITTRELAAMKPLTQLRLW